MTADLGWRLVQEPAGQPPHSQQQPEDRGQGRAGQRLALEVAALGRRTITVGQQPLVQMMPMPRLASPSTTHRPSIASCSTRPPPSRQPPASNQFPGQLPTHRREAPIE
jgi:hypothetical protein